MRAQHGRDAALEVVGEQVLVGGRLRVDIDQDDADILREGGEDAVGGGERAIDWPHERPAEDGEDGDRRAVAGRRQCEVAARGLGREVGRLAEAVIDA